MKETERYHQAEDDRHDALTLALHLRRNKHNSLSDPTGGALFDPLLEEYVLPHVTLMQLKAMEKLAVCNHEDLLKRTKEGSLFSSHSGATYDPVLQEYVVPDSSMLELKALSEDMVKKRELFHEMKVRREQNLELCELLCDPLVHSYRMRALVFAMGGPPADTITPQEEVKGKITPAEAVPSMYRKLNPGDDLTKATVEYHTLATAE